MRSLPATHPDDFPTLTPEALAERFRVRGLFRPGEAVFAHTEYERLIVGGVCPAGGELALPNPPELAAEHFLQRRELGIVATAGAGTVRAGGETYELAEHDVLYLGRGTRDVVFAGDARFYLVSAPAHVELPAVLSRRADAEAVRLGEAETANDRTIRKHIHLDGVASAQLALGVTTLEPGSVWNTMPPHIHARRTEVYLYIGLGEELVQHTMGMPGTTRSIPLGDHDAVVSPPWSIHTGAGTAAYSFIWATAGENLTYTDNVPVSVAELRA